MPGGYLVPKGSQVTAAIHSIHINKEHWSDPLTFRPERWGEEEAKRNVRNKAYLPFATGARSCIGFALALQEIKVSSGLRFSARRLTLSLITDTLLLYRSS